MRYTKNELAVGESVDDDLKIKYETVESTVSYEI